MTKILILNGPPNSGKDVIANEMVRRDPRIVHRKFATPLKEMTHKMLGITQTPAELDDVKDEYNIRIITGLVEEPLRASVISLREAYIRMSEKVIKPQFGNNIFGTLSTNAIEDNDDEFTVFSDGGFPEEMLKLTARFGWENVKIVHLYRDGTSFEGDSRGYVDGVYAPEGGLNFHFQIARIDNNRTIEEAADTAMGLLMGL